MYIRMTFRAVDVYDLLEPLLKDYRKLRLRSMSAFLSVSFQRLLYLDTLARRVHIDIHGRVCRPTAARRAGV